MLAYIEQIRGRFRARLARAAAPRVKDCCIGAVISAAPFDQLIVDALLAVRGAEIAFFSRLSLGHEFVARTNHHGRRRV